MAIQRRYPRSHAATINTGWTSVGNLIYDDNSYAELTGFLQSAGSFYNFGFNIPIGSTINSVTIKYTYLFSSGTGTNSFEMRTLKNGVEVGTAQIITTEPTAETALTKSENGTWSAEELNALDLTGLAINCLGNHATEAKFAKIDYIWVDVDYTPPEGSSHIFDFTGVAQTFLLKAGKRYLIECFGAQGGSNGSNYGGKGAYARGNYIPETDEVINIYVGGQPTTGSGGWNGGGAGSGRGGGGATDIRKGGTALTNRILVAAGGGGASNQGSNLVSGYGGELVGGKGWQFSSSASGDGGTQSAGGSTGGALGIGGSNTSPYNCGGGGGGYYGGGAAGGHYSAGGGGSSFIGTILNGCMHACFWEGAGKVVITEEDPNPTQLMTPLTFNYTGKPESIFLKKGKYQFDLYGAEAGKSSSGLIGGKGGWCKGILTFNEDTSIFIFVGEKPIQSVFAETRYGGWNGGGNAYRYTNAVTGGGGGGATDIRIGGAFLTDRKLVAGGGGGSGHDHVANGIYGGGGGLVGNDGIRQSNNVGGKGGTQSAGGLTGGAFGKGGGGSDIAVGGGGGGYYGGGFFDGHYAGAGGGSSYYGDAEDPETQAAVNTGHGYLIITPLSGAKKRRYSYVI